MTINFGVHLVTIRYSEDFRKNKVVSEVYSRLRDNGLDPVEISTNYNVGIGTGETNYLFRSSIDLPDKSTLEKMLKGINITELRVENAVVGALIK